MLGESQKTRNLILVRFSENKVPVLGFVFMKGLGFFLFVFFFCFFVCLFFSANGEQPW